MAFKKIVLEGEATVSSFNGSAVQTSGESFADNDTTLMTSSAINDRIGAISTNNIGDITQVSAGTGLTGGASTGVAVLNVIGGDGITANNDDVAVDSTVVRTSGTQTIDGAKTFSQNVVFTGDIQVNGNTITTDTETLQIANNTLILNSDLAGGSAVDTGFVIERGSTGNDQVLVWDESGSTWINGNNQSQAITGYSYISDVASIEKLNSANSSSTNVPIGHFQWDGSDLYVRTS